MTWGDNYTFAVEQRALAQLLADLPSAQAVAGDLPGDVAFALVNGRRDWRANGYRCQSTAEAKLLRPWGLCECATPDGAGLMLTNFGIDVRRAALGGDLGR